MRLLKEPFVGKGKKDESVAEFVERRLGREFLDYAINPFVAGVYAGSPEHLSVKAAFPKLFALEEKYGGLIKGMIKGRKERQQRKEKSKDRAKMFSFLEGMGGFPETVATRLGSCIRYNCEVESLKRSSSANGETPRYEIAYREGGVSRTLIADAIVISTPAHAASRLVSGLATSLARKLDSIEYPPVAEVFLGYTVAQIGVPLDGFGFLVPAVEHRNILGTIWSSVLFEERAPADHVALTTFVGGSRQPHLVLEDDANLLTLVTSDLAPVMKINGPPVYSRIARWKKAIPQYNLGYHRVLEEIEQAEVDSPGMFFCSNYRGGIAVGDCVMNAEKTAARVLEFMKSSVQQQSHEVAS
jgi:oxygen-dependent protoporphyrinogen oxidase